MSISSKTLSSIQQAGAAFYKADAELKNVAKEYAEQVHQAMQKNPFDVGNDGLFEKWKTIARLSTQLEQIETEFRKIYYAAENMNTNEVFALPHSNKRLSSNESAKTETPIIVPIDAVDVLPKEQKNQKALKKPVVKATPTPLVPANKKVTKEPAKKLAPISELPANSIKALTQFNKILNHTTFTKIVRAQVARDADFAPGTIGYSIDQLIKSGHLIQDESKALKLAKPNS